MLTNAEAERLTVIAKTRGERDRLKAEVERVKAEIRQSSDQAVVLGKMSKVCGLVPHRAGSARRDPVDPGHPPIQDTLAVPRRAEGCPSFGSVRSRDDLTRNPAGLRCPRRASRCAAQEVWPALRANC